MLSQKIFTLAKKFIAICFISIFTFTVITYSYVYAKPGQPLKEKFKTSESLGKGQTIENVLRQPTYSILLESYKEKGYAPVEEDIQIEINAIESVKSSNGSIPVKSGIGGRSQDVLMWEKDIEWFEWEIDVDVPGLYEIAFEYYPVESLGSQIRRSLMIDGQFLFSEANNIVFDRMWADEGEPKVNNIGDEVKPKQIEVPKWNTIALSDCEGMYTDPFLIYFSTGIHKIRLNYIDQPLAISKVILRGKRNIPTYEEVKKIYKEKNYKIADETIKFQAEKMLCRRTILL